MFPVLERVQMFYLDFRRKITLAWKVILIFPIIPKTFIVYLGSWFMGQDLALLITCLDTKVAPQRKKLVYLER